MATEVVRSGNPVLRSGTFESFGAADQRMTMAGTVNKTVTLLVLCTIAGFLSWHGVLTGQAGSLWAAAPVIGALGGFVVALITCFKQEWSPTTAPLYAILEGLFLGGVSAVMNKTYPGIVVQAVALTFLVFFCMLMAYKSGAIKVTQNFMLGVAAATGAICLFYVGSFILGLFGVTGPIQLMWSNGWFGIGLSVFVCVIAALNLVIDFAFIESGERQGAPKFMEWYGAFALMVTLVWLYFEILRLLAKMRSR